MNRDDLIRMAIKCQLVTTSNRDGIYMEALERFAALVAAAEREVIIKATIDQGFVGQAYADDFAAVIRNRGKQ